MFWSLSPVQGPPGEKGATGSTVSTYLPTNAEELHCVFANSLKSNKIQ